MKKKGKNYKDMKDTKQIHAKKKNKANYYHQRISSQVKNIAESCISMSIWVYALLWVEIGSVL